MWGKTYTYSSDEFNGYVRQLQSSYLALSDVFIYNIQHICADSGKMKKSKQHSHSRAAPGPYVVDLFTECNGLVIYVDCYGRHTEQDGG